MKLPFRGMLVNGELKAGSAVNTSPQVQIQGDQEFQPLSYVAYT